MSERYEENSRRTQRVRDVSTVLGFLTDHQSIQVPPTPHQPEAIEMGDFEEPIYHPSPIIIEDSRTGMDAEGNWHFIPHQPGGRWDDVGLA